MISTRHCRAVDSTIGSGVMIGIPGQSLDSLADDILLFRALDLDMIGVGPFIPHPQTMFGSSKSSVVSDTDQIPNTELMVYKVMALARPVSTKRPRSAGIALGVGSNRSAGVSGTVPARGPEGRIRES